MQRRTLSLLRRQLPLEKGASDLGDTMQDVKICLIGDVSGDGKITSADASKIFQHSQGKTNLWS